MFPVRYFNRRYWAGRFWPPPVSAGPAPPLPPSSVHRGMRARLLVRGIFGTLWDPALVDPDVYDVQTPSQTPFLELPDTRSTAGLSVSWGISGSRPTDLVASSGALSFTLDNGAGSAQGRYSPGHPNVRPGWRFGTPVRLVIEETYAEAIAAGADGDWTEDEIEAGVRRHVKHDGRVFSIHPTPGIYRDRTVVCTSYDRMRDLIAASVPDLQIATNKTPAELIAQVLDAAPLQAQPVARDLGDDPVGDVIPVAFVGGDTKVGGLLQTIAISVLGTAYIRGDGTFVWRSRHDRARALDGPILIHADDAVLHDLSAATSREGVFTTVKVTTHPRHVETNDPPTTIVYAASGTPLEAAPGVSSVWVDYQHPDDAQTLIAARDVLETATPFDHYEARTGKDGSGTDRTADITIAILPFGTRAKITISNPTPSRVYLVKSDGEPFFHLIGNAILDEGARTFRSVDDTQAVDQTLDLDLPLVDSDTVGQSFAEWLRLQHSIAHRVTAIEIRGTTPRLRSIISRLEPGQHLRVSETMTGASAVDVLTGRVQIEVPRSGVMVARVAVIPLRSMTMWSLGVSRLGVDTALGV